MVPGGIPRYGRAGGDVADDAALRRHARSGSNRHMVGEARLSGEDRVIVHGSAACNADLRHDETVSTDSDIVRDLYEIIDLGTSTDHGVIERTAVDGRVRAYLHVVFNHATANVRDGFVSGLTPSIPETGGSHPRAGMENDTISELRTGFHDGMRPDAAF